MVILELLNTGLLYMFLCFSEPLVWGPTLFCVFFGCVMQTVLLKKSRKKIWRMSILGVGFLGVAICECIWHLQTGWGLLIITMACLLLLAMLLGAGIAYAVFSIKEKKNAAEGKYFG